MIIYMTGKAADELLQYCTEKKPFEACGLLPGDGDGHSMHIDSFIPVPNIAEHSAERFLMDPAFQLPALGQIGAAKRSLAGIFHSHPNTPAVPSIEDLNTEWYTIPSHWIITLQDYAFPRIRVYRYFKEAGRMRYVELSLIILRNNKPSASF